MNNIKSKHIPVLDGIRAYAVLLVCIVHFFQVDEAGLYEANEYLGVFLFKSSQIGLKGVELFFLLSGFLITGILLESKNSPRYFTTFYARRFIRIFPLYYFVLAISFFLLPNFVNIDMAGKEVMNKQVWLWTYTSNISWFFGKGGWDSSLILPSFGHFWSLCVEEHFYVFWPFLIYFSNHKTLPRIMWWVVGISTFFVLFSYLSNNMIPIFTWSSVRYAGVLSLGGLIAYYMKEPLKLKNIRLLAKKYIVVLGIIFLVVNFIPRKYEIHEVLTLFASVLFFASLLVLSLEGNKTMKVIFNHKILFFIGKISYGIYIYHGLLRPYFKKYIYENLHIYFTNAIVASSIYTVVCTGISIFIAWLSWILIESTVLKLKKHFSY